jgi:hypothetical protein
MTQTAVVVSIFKSIIFSRFLEHACHTCKHTSLLSFL